MILLYVDNFRGFEETIIPLKDVNFFVGENSTGKTSILTLLKILSDPSFFFSEEFSSSDVALGYFSEIASKSSNKGQYFSIGLCSDLLKQHSGIEYILMKFINRDGVPKLSQVRVYVESTTFDFKISKSKLRYRTTDLKLKKDLTSIQKFYKWIHTPFKREIKFRSDNQSRGKFPPEATLFEMQLIIQKEMIKKKDKKKKASFRFPRYMYDITWIAPIRAKPRRTYDNYSLEFSPEGEHAPFLLRKLYSDRKGKSLSEYVRKIRKFGKESGLFERIEVKPLGREKTAPFEIYIYLHNSPFKISNVGYGVSQALPIMIEILSSSESQWFAIQQPEVHLHPRAQAALADLIYEANRIERKCFMIETHSDFLIDRFRYMIYKKNKKLKNPKSQTQILFFEQTKNGNKFHRIDILPDGKFSENQPISFRKFFVNENLKLLKI